MIIVIIFMIILANFGKWEKLSSHDHHRDNGDDDDDHHDDGLSGNQWLKPARHSPLISATCFQSPGCLPLCLVINLADRM